MKTVSPCIARCFTNGNHCPSCGRTDEERIEWYDASEDRKQQIIKQCTSRLEPEAFEYWEEMYEYKCEDRN